MPEAPPGLWPLPELLAELARSQLEELLAELARSQLEVKRMLGMQSAQAQQLGGLKEQLAAESAQAQQLGGWNEQLVAKESFTVKAYMLESRCRHALAAAFFRIEDMICVIANTLAAARPARRELEAGGVWGAGGAEAAAVQLEWAGRAPGCKRGHPGCDRVSPRWVAMHVVLEALGQQPSSLERLNENERRLDASKSILDATGEPRWEAMHRSGCKACQPVLRKFATHGEAGACRRLGPGETQGGEGEDAEADPDLKEDYNPEEIAELQAKLDADLADMFSQLQVCVHVFVASVASAQNVRAPARWRPARWRGGAVAGIGATRGLQGFKKLSGGSCKVRGIWGANAQASHELHARFLFACGLRRLQSQGHLRCRRASFTQAARSLPLCLLAAQAAKSGASEAVKSEASEVSTRKLQLERELQELLAQR
eukprot:1150352-Pelagomonas_calceolata.AAC.2